MELQNHSVSIYDNMVSFERLIITKQDLSITLFFQR